MTYPNAAKGVKKIFTSQIISLVASVILAVVAILVVVVFSVQNTRGEAASIVVALIAMIAGFAALVVLIVGGIIGVVGYVQAGSDEPGFKKSIMCVVASIILTVSSTMLSNETGFLGWLSTGLNIAAEVLELLAFIFAVTALMRLSEKCGRPDLVERGRTILRFLAAIYFLYFVALVLNEYFMGGSVNTTLAFITAAIVLVLGVMQYVLFISYLSKAHKMLLES